MPLLGYPSRSRGKVPETVLQRALRDDTCEASIYVGIIAEACSRCSAWPYPDLDNLIGSWPATTRSMFFVFFFFPALFQLLSFSWTFQFTRQRDKVSVRSSEFGKVTRTSRAAVDS